ncbi:MAG TPA: iron ABC transporter permease [Devosiaceae bacterium]|nr:iron ABC transporter permease [Devosiaceae bacterium]
MAVVAAIVSVGAALPLAFVVLVAVQTGWAASAPLVFRPRVAELLVNTGLLVLLTVPICIVLGVTLAWLTERSDLPGRNVWSWLSVAPLAVPAFVHSYAWISAVPSLNGLAAGVLISVLAYFPFMYLPVVAAMRRLDPALEDAAASLGQKPGQVFRRVMLPQLRLAICGGALLVGLHLLGEYGLFAMIRFDTFTTAIIDQFRSTFNGPAANMLAGVLVVCCFALLGAETWFRGSSRYARIGSGAARPAGRTCLGRATVPCLLLPAGLAVLSLGVPLLTLGKWLLAGGVAAWLTPELGAALFQTALWSLAGAALTTLAALPMAWLTIRAPGRMVRFFEGLNYVVGALPGVVIGLALVTITVRVAQPIYQTVWTLLIAYAVMFLPRALISLRASIAQAPAGLEEIAQSLGRHPIHALWSVTLRLAAPGAAASMALVALGISNELTATQMLAPNGTETLATAFWSLSGELDYASAAPYAVLMIIVSLPLVWLLHAQSQRLAGR